MKDFICINDCSIDELNELLELGAGLKQQDKAGTLKRTLDGKAVAIVFEKASLRTRVSFEVAIANLGGLAVYLKPEDIGILGEREPIKDIARVLSRYVNGIIARTFAHDSLIELAKFSTVPVINALSDFTHPCEAMSDMLTIKEHLGRLEGARLAFIGDGNNVELDDKSIKTANSTSEQSVTQVRQPREAVKGADVIYTDTWISMGQEAEQQKRIEAFKSYQVNSELLKLAPDAKIMHCLPAHRGYEITDEIAESTNSVIFDQSENRLHFQKALLQKLLAG